MTRGPVLVLGASGMLGHEIVARAPSDARIAAARVEITDPRAIAAAMDAARPTLVINAAGYTAVDAAETALERAWAVNATGVGELAKACAARGVPLVHFSSDYVFAGSARRPYREDDACEPVNAYGRSKRGGEIAIEASGAEHLIIRTQWLFGAHGRSFPRTMWERAAARRETRVVDDQFGRPTFARDLADWTWRLVDRGARGIIHAANAGEASWFDVAEHVFAHAGAGALVARCATADYPTPARRPAYSVLETGRLEALLGALPEWRDAIDRFLREL